MTPLYEFIYYVYQHLQGSMEYSREETLKMMKINLEVKKVMAYLLMEVEKGLKKWFYTKIIKWIPFKILTYKLRSTDQSILKLLYLDLLALLK